MKTIDFEFEGKGHPLCLNGAALFDIYERWGKDANILKLVTRENKKGFDALCAILSKLSEQGSAVHTYLTGERIGALTEVQLRLTLRPWDTVEARAAVARAVSLGFARSEEDEADADPWLQKIEQKKKKGRSRGRLTFTRRRGPSA